MRVTRRPDHIVRERGDAFRKKRGERVNELRRAEQKKAALSGMDFVRQLDGGRRITLGHGRQYWIPPVPWKTALRVLEAQEMFDAFTKQAAKHRDNPDVNPSPTIEDWAAIYDVVVVLFKQVCRPLGRLRRLLWPFTPSPLRNASPSEVAMALNFFSECLKLDAIDALIRETLPPPGTSPSSSPASSPPIPLSARANGGRPSGPGPSRGRRS